MTRRQLGLNLNHVALLRQVRGGDPDPVAVGLRAETAGVDAIVAHLREDRKYIQERDARLLRQLLKTRLILQLAGTQEMLKLAYDIKPDHVILVPEVRDDAISIAPMDVQQHRDHVRKYVQGLQDGDIPVSLYVDPDLDQIRAAHRVEAGGVVIDAGKYVLARTPADRSAEFRRIADAAKAATKLGMPAVLSGGLDMGTVSELSDMDDVSGFHLGHALISRALLVGLDAAVRDLRTVLD